MPADKLKRRQNNFYFSLSQYDYNDNIEIYLYDMIAHILLRKNIVERDDDSDLYLTEKITAPDFEEYISLDAEELVELLRVIEEYGISEDLYKILKTLYVLNEERIEHDYYSTMKSRYNYEEEIEYVRKCSSTKKIIFDYLTKAVIKYDSFKERIEKIAKAIDNHDLEDIENNDLEYPEEDHPRFF